MINVIIVCKQKGERMSNRSGDKRRHLTLVYSSDHVVQLPSKEFNIQAFLSQGDTIDTKGFEIPPEYYGKTINGVQYGDPTREPILLYVDQNNQPVFDC